MASQLLRGSARPIGARTQTAQADGTRVRPMWMFTGNLAQTRQTCRKFSLSRPNNRPVTFKAARKSAVVDDEGNYQASIKFCLAEAERQRKVTLISAIAGVACLHLLPFA